MASNFISPIRNLQKFTLFLFPFIGASLLLLLLINKQFYLSILREDGIVEWLTFFGLFSAGILSLLTAIRIKKKYNYWHWFFVLFFLFNVFAGLEEVSYGQRVFDIETTGVFAKYNDQYETNIHNTVQGIFNIKTKNVSLWVLFIYGVILPLIKLNRKNKIGFIANGQLITPPAFLIIGFFLGTVFMLDFITGYEEEGGEFIYSICFVIFMLHQYFLSQTAPVFNRKNFFKSKEPNTYYKAVFLNLRPNRQVLPNKHKSPLRPVRTVKQ